MRGFDRLAPTGAVSRRAIAQRLQTLESISSPTRVLGGLDGSGALRIGSKVIDSFASITFDTPTTTDALTITNNGNVGIGDLTPARKLSVIGTILATDSANSDLADIGSLSLVPVHSSPTAGRLIFGTDGTGWKFHIAQQNGGTVTDIMTFLTGGNVGIGVTSPTAELDVSGMVRANGSASGTGPSSGAGVELDYFSGGGYITAYDRGAAAYKPLYIRGSEMHLRQGATNVLNISTAGDVGIGRDSTGFMLEVQGEIYTANSAGLRNSSTYPAVWLQNNNGTKGILIAASDDDSLRFVRRSASWGAYEGTPCIFKMVAPDNSLVLGSGGDLGIGVATPSYRLDVYDSLSGGGGTWVARIHNAGGASTSAGLIVRAGESTNPTAHEITFLNGGGSIIGSIAGNGSGGVAYNTTSDERTKEDIKTLAGSLGKVMAMRPVSYRGKGAGPGGKRNVGLVAQELRSILPEVVVEDDTGLLGIGYGAIVPVLVGAIQELTARVEQLGG